MKEELSSLPVHPAAKAYYEETKLLPAPEPVDWLRRTYWILGMIAIVIAGYRGLIKLRRDRTSDQLVQKIFAVRVDSREPYSATKLADIRAEIGERVTREWWRRGELNKRRWHDLEDLIENRMLEAMDNLMRGLLKEMRTIDGECAHDDTQRKTRYASLETRVWQHLENGELNSEQHGLILKLLRERPRDGGTSPES